MKNAVESSNAPFSLDLKRGLALGVWGGTDGLTGLTRSTPCPLILALFTRGLADGAFGVAASWVSLRGIDDHSSWLLKSVSIRVSFWFEREKAVGMLVEDFDDFRERVLGFAC